MLSLWLKQYEGKFFIIYHSTDLERMMRYHCLNVVAHINIGILECQQTWCNHSGQAQIDRVTTKTTVLSNSLRTAFQGDIIYTQKSTDRKPPKEGVWSWVLIRAFCLNKLTPWLVVIQFSYLPSKDKLLFDQPNI